MVEVSVITPCHNVPLNWMQDLVSSLKKQNVDLELVVVSDATEEKLQEEVKEYLFSEDINLIYDEKIFLSPAKTRNHAIKKSSGEYLSFVDADDYLEKNALSKGLVEFDKKTDMVLFDRKKVNADGSKIIYETKNKQFLDFHKKYKNTINDIFLRMNFYGIKGIFKKEAVLNAKLFDDNYYGSEDTDLMLKIMDSKEELNVKAIEGSNYVYRENLGSVSQTKVERLRGDAIKTINSALVRRGFEDSVAKFTGRVEEYLFTFFDIYKNNEKIIPPYCNFKNEDYYILDKKINQ
ncbi:MAG: glycosyltransferase family 2 protein [archaeon]|jgi:glycosyltransferase involved in cell wall biosynthesis